MLKNIKAVVIFTLSMLLVIFIAIFIRNHNFNSCDYCKEIKCCYCEYNLDCENLSKNWHENYFESLNYEDDQAKNMIQGIREAYIDDILADDEVIEKHVIVSDNLISANVILTIKYDGKDYNEYCESIVDKCDKSLLNNIEILLVNNKNKCVYQFKK